MWNPIPRRASARAPFAPVSPGRSPTAHAPGRFRQKNFAMGRPKANADKALALAARLGDEETARTLFSPRMKSLFSVS